MRCEEVASFLKSVSPFKTLSSPVLDEISTTMVPVSFLPNTRIIRRGDVGTDFFLIQSGLVKVGLTDKNHEETIISFLGDGECFGEISLISGDTTMADVITVEKTICLSQKNENFLKMIKNHPALMTYFHQLLANRMRTVYKEFLSEQYGISMVEPFIYTKLVRDMVSERDLFIHETATIDDAAAKILERRLDTLIVLSEDGEPLGTVRPHAIINALIHKDHDRNASIKTVMTDPPCQINGSDYFFDALHEMIRSKTNLLVVKDHGRIKGVLTGFDLLRFRGREVLSLVKNIEKAESVSQLSIMRNEVENVLRALMDDGALASHACKIISEFNDKIVKKIIEITQDELGNPPCPYCWLGLGSEGRREQTLFTDQDNAIIFGDHASDIHHKYFKNLAEQVVTRLHECGIPLCKGGVMASKDQFLGSLSDWKSKITRWVHGSTIDDKERMDAYVFLDFRAVCGDTVLEKKLKEHLHASINESQLFLQVLAEDIVSIPIPIGFFRNFIVEKSGQHKDRLNVKLYGLVPLVTCIKILAIQKGIVNTNTLERIQLLVSAGVLSPDLGEMLEQAFETFLALKIRNNLIDIDQGKTFGNHIQPTDLSTCKKQLLKEAFHAVAQLQKKTREALRINNRRFDA